MCTSSAIVMYTYKDVGKLIFSENAQSVDWKLRYLNRFLDRTCNFIFLSPSFRYKCTLLKIILQVNTEINLVLMQVVQANDITQITNLIHKRGIRCNYQNDLELDFENSDVVYAWTVHDLKCGSAYHTTIFVEFQEPGICIDCETSSLKQMLYDSSNVCGKVEMKGLNTLIDNLKDMYCGELYSDITIEVGDQKFKAHKSILSARSPVLKAMLKHDMAEKNSNSVEISDYEPEIVQELLLYLYCGRMNSMSDENVVELFKIADKYQVDDLKLGCVDYMKNHLSVDLFCDVIQLSVIHKETELLDLSKEYFKSNAKKILLSTKWPQLSKENHTLADELFLMMIPDE